MTKGSKTMKERTPKTTNRLHTQERTKENKIIVEKKVVMKNMGREGGRWG
jgi:hypothetical protein